MTEPEDVDARDGAGAQDALDLPLADGQRQEQRDAQERGEAEREQGHRAGGER